VFPLTAVLGGEFSLQRIPHCYNQTAASIIIVTAAPKLLLCDFRCSLFLSDTQNVSLAPAAHRAALGTIGVAVRPPQFQPLPLGSGLKYL
jgi:hypothetical protein